ncbi:hypothetical protein [Sphingomonas panni]|uniref:hypothetical protein n=1 Tax=Sphingomonas panni TaxID=237612 RepID=UPI001F5BC43F|nr:hypothetical protein [Sphingomonas panni]
MTTFLALAISLATIWIEPSTDERAMYGTEGPTYGNWLPRKVAGWPAPFLADDVDVSVPHEIGPEDLFRPGPFLGTLSFWLLVVAAADAFLRTIFRRGRRE